MEERTGPAELSDLTSQCIRCGFCLEACPTFSLTGAETESPRGRIYLVRSADEGNANWQAIAPHLDRCLGCRACEPACPSGVQYGQILELARERVRAEQPRRVEKSFLDVMVRPGAFRAQIALAGLLPGRRLPGVLNRLLAEEPPEADLPTPQPAHNWPALEEATLPPVRGKVGFLLGCVMRVLFPRVHEASLRLLRRVGYRAVTLESCCGALHAHAGYLDEARNHAARLCRELPPEMPLVVNAAGCGSTLKGYGHLLPGDGEAVARQTLDLSEFLLREGLLDHLALAPGWAVEATYHDACHLAHGQGVREAPRRLLEAVPGLRLRPLEESDRCCGSAGTYNLMQPALARALLERKWDHVEKTGARVLIQGNPGCHAWLDQAAREHGGRVRVVHTAEALEAAFSGPAFGDG